MTREHETHAAVLTALRWALKRVPDDGSATYAAAHEALWRAEGRAGYRAHDIGQGARPEEPNTVNVHIHDFISEIARMTMPTDGLSPDEMSTWEDDRSGSDLMSDSEALHEIIEKAREIIGGRHRVDGVTC